MHQFVIGFRMRDLIGQLDLIENGPSSFLLTNPWTGIYGVL